MSVEHLPVALRRPARAAVCLAFLASCSRSRPTAAGSGLPDAGAEPPPAVLTPADLQRLPAAFHVPPSVTRDTDLPPREEVHFKSGPYQLVGFVYRPNLAGPLPTIVYNHGSELNPTLESLGRVARWWQARGFVVFVPFRRGSNGPEGSSEGPFWQSIVDARPEAERDRATVEQLDAQNDDVLAAIALLSGEYYVDRRFIAVSGCSFGGIETVLTAQRSSALYAALDFAGAAWSWSRSAPMRERLTAAVRESRVPIMFLQAENDYDTTPSKMLSAAMRAVDKPARVKLYPPYGATTEDGHGGFCNRAMAYWGDDALAFLREAAFRSLPAQP